MQNPARVPVNFNEVGHEATAESEWRNMMGFGSDGTDFRHSSNKIPRRMWHEWTLRKPASDCLRRVQLRVHVMLNSGCMC